MRLLLGLEKEVCNLVLLTEQHLAWLGPELQVSHRSADEYTFGWRWLTLVSLRKTKLAGVIELGLNGHIHFDDDMARWLTVKMDPIMGLVGVLDEGPVFFSRLADLVGDVIVEDGFHCGLVVIVLGCY